MIVPMKKITVITLSERGRDTVKTLQDLGAVHITSAPRPHAPIDNLQQEIHKIQNILKLLPDEGNNSSVVYNTSEIQTLHEKMLEKEKLEKELASLNGEKEWYDTFGNVSLAEIYSLGKNGVNITFHEFSKKEEKFCSREDVITIAREKKKILVAHITTSSEELPGTIPLPNRELKEINEDIARYSWDKTRISGEIEKKAHFRKHIQSHLAELEKQLRLESAYASMQNHSIVETLEGFIPYDKVEDIKICAEKHGWSYVIEDPDEKDTPPTLIRNPRWVSLINPILSFMGTIPGYREIDISMFFLIFLSVFFALLVGDAGYGMLFLGLTFVTRRILKKLQSQPFELMYVFSACTILWGAITGTWFGSETLSQLPVIRHITIPSIASFSPGGGFNDSQDIIMEMCFIIGSIHLTLAHVLNGLRHIGSLKAIAQIGWIAIIWGLYFVVGMFVLSKTLPNVAIWLIAAGSALVMLFSNPQKNILKGILSSLTNLPLSIISGFSDVVSYLRLFAVGYASLIVAYSFNQMAIGNGIDGPVSGLIAAFVLFFGHGLNILLAMMGVIVHGVRLNTLEFSGHVDLEWSGKKYNPLN